MATLVLRDVVKRYEDGVTAVDRFSLSVADGEFVVLVGPSGCGKSTLLRAIAGLEEITSGGIEIDGKLVNRIPPKDRDVAMVFQSYALYPHMSVRDNIGFGLKMRGVPRQQIDREVSQAARLLHIEEYLDRKPKSLSGGQRQRVALGRAIVRRPKCFLFDEPLSNLDAKLRTGMRTEIRQLQLRLRTTSIYVTHDQEEAMTLGDRIVVMRGGVAQQVGSPIEIYERPANRFVAAFLGTPEMNFIDGRIVRDAGQVFFRAGPNCIPLCEDSIPQPEMNPVVLGIRPQGMRIVDPADAKGVLTARVELIEVLGDRMDVFLTIAACPRLVVRTEARPGFRPDDEVRIAFDVGQLHWFEAGVEGRRLQ